MKAPVLPVALIVVAVALAYANTFSVPFVFDDIAAVTQNPSIERLSTALSPPDGLSVSGRPLVNLSLALNYAICGREVWSYHALNLGLHLACALTLFALIRHTLQCVSASGPSSANPPAPFVALATSLLWALHPLQTAAVTYVMQRSELLVSLCYVLTLYGFSRGAAGGRLERERAQTQPAWLVLSVVACACGMAAKEVMVSAPLIVLLYDRTFVAGSLRAALRQRSVFYVSLASSWVLLAALVLGGDNRGASAGWASEMPWAGYAMTQLWAVPHYLRLALWPVPLVFDYGTVLVESPALVASGGALLLALLAFTLVALRRWPAAGFCGAVFFALLAPSSSVVPVATQTIAEHRVYLALVIPLLVLALLAAWWLGRSTRWMVLPLALGLGLATIARNNDYSSVPRLWERTVEQRPENARAHYNLGLTLWAQGDAPRARTQFAATVALEPGHQAARKHLGTLLLQAGRPAEALEHFLAVVRAQPRSAAAHYDAAVAQIMLSRPADALAYFAESIRLNPAQPTVRYNFGKALAELGRYADALVQFEEAARLDPTEGAARDNATRIREYLRK